jgi:transketolase
MVIHLSLLLKNVRLRFEALGLVTYLVKDGNNINDINKAINKAKDCNHPVLIEIKTNW